MADSTTRPSVFTLVKHLSSDFRTFIRQEIQLAKTEVSEKISSMGKNAVSLAIGAFVAYAGLIVLLIGLGILLAYAFEAAGLDTMMAGFLGLGSIGLVVAIIGVVFVLKAIKGFSQESLAPERTIQTIQDLKGGAAERFEEAAEQEEPESPPRPTSEEMQARVEATEYRMSENLGELGQRLDPKHINAQIKNRISARPYKSGGIALALGVLSGLLLKRKFSRA